MRLSGWGCIRMFDKQLEIILKQLLYMYFDVGIGF